MNIERQIPTINYRDKHYFLEKRYDIGNSNRTLLPEETLKKIKPYFKQIGLTRLGNITGLDRIGVPVTIAIRPNSYSLSQSSGKSTNLDAALVSAAMESIELYCAENIKQEIIRASYTQIQNDYKNINLEDLEYNKYSLFNINRPEDWILGWDIINQEEVAVPYHSVSLDFRVFNERTSPNSFIMSSNGLASGNHFLEAVISAIYEVIERDSTSCHIEAQLYGKKKNKIDLSTIANAEIQKLCQQLESKKLIVNVFDCTTDIEVPVFDAYLYDLESNDVSICHGYGAHLNPHIAIFRAITEAIQGRNIVISGSRDDLFKDTYNGNRLRYQSFIEKVETSKEPEAIKMSYSDQTTQTFNEDILLLINKLKKVGLNQVIVVDLSPPDIDISVVRVIIPGLESYHFPSYYPRRRAKKFVAENCDLALPISSRSKAISKKEMIHLAAGGAQ